MTKIRACSMRLSIWLKEQRGTAGAEFALLAPIYLLLMVGTVDVANALYTDFNLSSALTSAANYALTNASQVNSSGGATLAANLAAIVASSHSTNWANATVTVNNGPAAAITGGVSSTSGTASRADSYYCPTGKLGSLVWNSAYSSAGSVCPSGGLSGKFVVISASRSFTPLLLPSSFFNASGSVWSVVQVQ
ncbi:TadE/TadG family type IV pilus assembly protein [Methylocystis heyeri]|uniref:Pilus assembly protein n=1 Tax=Methylocystis heyeri TaxID=391905 RepID=A0A6B8KEA4_9HYPH|nr:TadE/TadG family type IV pilus assembly protein [Methylocystis heyeri]QGM45942.1 pilus assembly protein [Methylocystis heyeri]